MKKKGNKGKMKEQTLIGAIGKVSISHTSGRMSFLRKQKSQTTSDLLIDFWITRKKYDL